MRRTEKKIETRPENPADDQPTGAPLPGWTGLTGPSRTPLEGRVARLEPLDARHAGDLYRAWHEALDTRAWTYMGYERPDSLEATREWIDARATDDIFFAIISRKTGEALGVAAYIRIDPANGVLEIAHINFSPRLRRTRLATEAIYLLISNAFETLGYRRCEWKCDSLNAPSRSAAVRFGFTFEGIFRQAMVYKGRNRDTAWYAIIDGEWPSLKAAFELWLSDASFAADGTQHQRLSALTGVLKA